MQNDRRLKDDKLDTSSEALLAELLALILSVSASVAEAGEGLLLSRESRAFTRHSAINSNWCSRLAK